MPLSLLYFRALRYPFRQCLSSRTISSITLLIYIIALTISFPFFYYNKYEPHPESCNKWKCKWKPPGVPETRKYSLIIAACQSTFVIFLPLFLIVVVQLLTYMHLTQSARRRRSTVQDVARIKELNRVSGVFATIAGVFFTLTLPSSIFILIFWHYVIHDFTFVLRHRHLMNDLSGIFNILLATNSCVNPLLYAKIHKKLLRRIRMIFEKKRSVKSESHTLTQYPTEGRSVDRI